MITLGVGISGRSCKYDGPAARCYDSITVHTDVGQMTGSLRNEECTKSKPYASCFVVIYVVPISGSE